MGHETPDEGLERRDGSNPEDEGIQSSAFDANDYSEDPCLEELAAWMEDEVHWRYSAQFDALSFQCETVHEAIMYRALLIAQSETPAFLQAIITPNKRISFGYRPDFALEAVGYQPIYVELTSSNKEYRNSNRQRATRLHRADVYEVTNAVLNTADNAVILARGFLSDLFSIRRR